MALATPASIDGRFVRTPAESKILEPVEKKEDEDEDSDRGIDSTYDEYDSENDCSDDDWVIDGGDDGEGSNDGSLDEQMSDVDLRFAQALELGKQGADSDDEDKDQGDDKGTSKTAAREGLANLFQFEGELGDELTANPCT